jgi:hypothetical protein
MVLLPWTRPPRETHPVARWKTGEESPPVARWGCIPARRRRCTGGGRLWKKSLGCRGPRACCHGTDGACRGQLRERVPIEHKEGLLRDRGNEDVRYTWAFLGPGLKTGPALRGAGRAAAPGPRNRGALSPNYAYAGVV